MNRTKPSLETWRLIDGIGPFFRHVPGKRINWSKIPFADWESKSGMDRTRIEMLQHDFQRFTMRAAAEGFNAVTLDDVPHLADWQGYPPALRMKINRFRCIFRKLFLIAEANGLNPLLTTDVLSYPRDCAERIGFGAQAATDWLAKRLDELFADFPLLAGIVLRIGECDSNAETSDFQSRLVVRTPRQARYLLRTLLPVFERHHKVLFFRLWTVGVYPIGDLMWHRGTFRRVFGEIDSPSLVLSLKHGESDFFRHLPVNAHFFRSRHQKIVEFQARREYEGFGEYPAFAGIQAQQVLHQLSAAPGLVGISVWCQTGGWGRFHRLTYVQNSSPWVELNTSVLCALARGGNWRTAAMEWLKRETPEAESDFFPDFLQQSDQVIEDLLYVREFSLQKWFFRRLRVPPLLYVFWDRILVNRLLRKILRSRIHHPQEALRQGQAAFETLESMVAMAHLYRFPDLGLDFQRDTFQILLAVRAYYLDRFDPEQVERIRRLKSEYKAKWRPRYSIKTDFRPSGLRRRHVRWILVLLFRQRRGYRIIDRVFTLRLLSVLHAMWGNRTTRLFPRFARKQAMGIDSLFR